jgi:hypothetical protein
MHALCLPIAMLPAGLAGYMFVYAAPWVQALQAWLCRTPISFTSLGFSKKASL